MIRLVVLLHQDFSQSLWFALTESNAIQEGRITDLPPHASEREVYVILPQESILLTTVTLPKLTRQRLQNALPFALEEYLIDDVNALHFATGDYQAGGFYPVAVVSKKQMDAWLALLKSFNLTPSAFVPAAFLLPWNDDTCYLSTYNDLSLARFNKWVGFACEPSNVNVILALENEKLKTSHTIETVSFPDKALLHDINRLEYINLLQGAYTVKHKTTNVKKFYGVASALLVASVLLFLMGNLFSYFLLARKDNQLESQIEAIYHANFPHASSLIAPKERMADKLKSSVTNLHKNYLIFLLADIAKNYRPNEGVDIRKLDFERNQLSLNVHAKSFEALDQFTERLEKSGLTVKQQHANTVKNAIEATLLIIR